MQAFLDELGALHPMLPILVKAIVLMLAALVTWFVLSIPAYWIFRALNGPLTRIATSLGGAHQRLMEALTRLFAWRTVPAEHFVSLHAQYFAFDRENAEFADELAAIRSAVQSVPTTFSSLERAITDAQRVTKDSSVAMQRILWPLPIEPPSPGQYSAVRIERNDAWLRVITFGLFAAALIAINTLMLKEFFAAFVPPLRFFGVPLAVVLALLFSVLELAFGAFFAFIEGNASAALFGRSIIGGTVVLLALLELGFYARFGAEYEFDPFATLWAPDKPPPWTKSWLGLFGPLVVLGLAYSGHMLFTALRILFRDNVVHQYRRFLHLRTRNADDVESRLAAAQAALTGVTGAFRDVSAACKPTAEGLSVIAGQILDVRTRFQDAVGRAQEIRLQSVKDVGPAEMIRTLYLCMFHALSIAIAFLVIALAFGAFGFNAPIMLGTVMLPGIAVSIGETIFMLGAGSVTGHVMSHMSVGEQFPKKRGITVAAVFAYAVVVAVTAGNGIAFANRGTLIDLMWFSFAFAACLWLFVVGRRLGLILAATWSAIQAVAVLCVAVMLYLAIVFLFVLRVTVDVALVVLAILAYPFKALVERARKSNAAPAASRALGMSLVLMATASWFIAPAIGQQIQVEPQSSITVLVDLSATWLNSSSEDVNTRVLQVVADAIAMLATDVDAPIAVRYLPIGDLSLARDPLCELTFTPKLLPTHQERTEVSNLKSLTAYLSKACVRFILSRKPQQFTDITSAFDSVGRAVEEQAGAFKAIIVLSDLKEERRRNQKPAQLHLRGTHTLLLYRVLNEDRVDPSGLDTRIDGWKHTLRDAGSTVRAINDIAASPGEISRVLKQ